MTTQEQAQTLRRLDQLYEQKDSFRIWPESTCSGRGARTVALMSNWKSRTRRSEAPSTFFVKSKGSPRTGPGSKDEIIYGEVERAACTWQEKPVAEVSARESFQSIVSISRNTFVNCLLSRMSTNHTQFVCGCQEEMSHGSLEEEASAFL